MESMILNTLQFDLTVVTQLDFIDLFLKTATNDNTAKQLAHVR